MSRIRHILLLGGTAAARKLAEALAVALPKARITYALAGATPHPRLPRAANIEVRIGGFGGADGLARWLREQDVAALIDATHPHARHMPHNAATAASLAGVAHARFLPRLPDFTLAAPAATGFSTFFSTSCPGLTRASRRRLPQSPALSALDCRGKPGNDERGSRARGIVWLEHAEEAVHLLPRGARVAVALGSRGLAALRERGDLHLHARMLATPVFCPLPRWRLCIGKKCGPRGSMAAEMVWLRTIGAQCVLARHAAGSRQLVAAALRLGLPVLLVRPPASPQGVLVLHSMQEVRDWLATHFSR